MRTVIGTRDRDPVDAAFHIYAELVDERRAERALSHDDALTERQWRLLKEVVRLERARLRRPFARSGPVAQAYLQAGSPTDPRAPAERR
jgi:hypothetical protein